MYMWKNIFHVVPMRHRDILRIFCECHKNIPKISIPTHKFMFIGSLACFVASLLNLDVILYFDLGYMDLSGLLTSPNYLNQL